MTAKKSKIVKGLIEMFHFVDQSKVLKKKKKRPNEKEARFVLSHRRTLKIEELDSQLREVKEDSMVLLFLSPFKQSHTIRHTSTLFALFSHVSLSFHLQKTAKRVTQVEWRHQYFCYEIKLDHKKMLSFSFNFMKKIN